MNSAKCVTARYFGTQILRRSVSALTIVMTIPVTGALGQALWPLAVDVRAEGAERVVRQGACSPEWQSAGVMPGVGGPISSFMQASVTVVTSWDPDGAGPMQPELVVGGLFSMAGSVSARNIAAFNGHEWHPLGATGLGDFSSNTRLSALTTWDPDGPGPLTSQLFAGGKFSLSGSPQGRNIERWDGGAWVRVGPSLSLSSEVFALTTWDPDGSGPLSEQLIVGGRFAAAGTVTVNHIARWDGEAWHSLGTGMDAPVTALATWDPDGAGPAASRLVAAGYFTMAGGTPAVSIAEWDGVAWQPLGPGISGTIRAMTVWDPDGVGPLNEELIAAGWIGFIDGVFMAHIAAWDGESWNALSDGLFGPLSVLGLGVTSVTAWDPDGPGPLSPLLAAGGDFATEAGIRRTALWDGDAWHACDLGTEHTVYAVGVWDPDGSGPLPAEFISGGEFTSMDGTSAMNRVAKWNGTAWRGIGDAPDDIVLALCSNWDPDREGPIGSSVVAAGSFQSAGGGKVNRIARWDGSDWSPIGEGFGTQYGGAVIAVSAWDSDGVGPGDSVLVAGGRFANAGETALMNIARWDGTAWLPLGAGLGGPGNAEGHVYALEVWDPDALGEQPPKLIAGGSFTVSGGVPINRVAWWDGGAWQPLGAGADDYVSDLAVWDPDSAGPISPKLIAAGGFSSAGGVLASHIAQWNGGTWEPLGLGVNGNVGALVTWDPDGPGPLAEHLVAGGAFTEAGGMPANRVALWNGAEWQPLGLGMGGSVYSLATWIPESSSTHQAVLVAGGNFIVADGKDAKYVACWDGLAWSPLGSGLELSASSSVNALASWAPSSSDYCGQQLAVGGRFSAAGGVLTSNFAIYGGRTTIAPPHCNGDADGNRNVDFEDVTTVITHWGAVYASEENRPGDSNDDGVVNHEDISETILNWGVTCP